MGCHGISSKVPQFLASYISRLTVGIMVKSNLLYIYIVSWVNINQHNWVGTSL